MTNDCKTCPVSTGTHKPAEALHQIAEPDAQHLQELAAYRFTVENREARIAELEDALQFVERWAVHHGSKPSISAEEALSCIQHYPAIHEITKSYKDGKRPDTFNPYARIAELESQLEAIGAGGVEPLRKQAAAPQAVQAAVPEAIEQMAVDRYKVVPSHESMFHRWAVVAGNGTQQLYIGREGECQNMARKFMGAFLDGAFVAMQNASPAHPAEGVPANNGLTQELADMLESTCNGLESYRNTAPWTDADEDHLVECRALLARAALAATQPAAQGMEQEYIKSQHQLAEMTARAEHAEAKAAEEQEHAAFYRWMRDQNDWYAGPRIDAADGTVWKLTMYSPQEIMAPDDDDSLDAAIRSALAAQAKQGGA